MAKEPLKTLWDRAKERDITLQKAVALLNNEWKSTAIGKMAQKNIGSRRLEKRLRAALENFLGSTDSVTEQPMYGMRDEPAPAGALPTKEDCVDYLRKFLDTCDRADKIAWVKVELSEKFPLNKWSKDKHD